MWRSLDFSLQNRRLQQVGALVVTLCGALLVAAVAGLLHSGATDALALGLRLLFGFGAIVVAVMVMAGGAWALRGLVNDTFVIAWRRVVGGEVLFIALLSLVHIPITDARAAADRGDGGGMIGWAISQLLMNKVGMLPAVGLLLLIALIGAVWAFRLDFSGTGDWINRQLENFQHRAPAEEPDRGRATHPHAAPTQEDRLQGKTGRERIHACACRLPRQALAPRQATAFA